MSWQWQKPPGTPCPASCAGPRSRHRKQDGISGVKKNGDVQSSERWRKDLLSRMNSEHGRSLTLQDNGPVPSPSRRSNMTEQNVSRLVSVKQLSERLDVCRATVYNMINRGTLPPLKKMGRSSRWHEADIAPFFEQFKSDRLPPSP